MLSSLRFPLLLFLSPIVAAGPPTPASTTPHAYPGIPDLPYSTEWQAYFNVSAPLLNVDFPLGRNFAGNINVDRQGHPNNTLFFWAFEKSAGSLTATDESGPWIIWLNGGPGSSSLLGLFVENGPVHLTQGQQPTSNPFSFDKLADTFWIDQPVGSGWSTTDSTGWVKDEEQAAQDFVNFLTNLVKVFPNLAKRPLHLMGESYAGVYIPYITKALFGLANPPVTLKKIAIGNGVVGSVYLGLEAPMVNVLETFPQLINYNAEVLSYYQEQTRLCGFDLQLTYPQQGGKFPSLTSFRTVADPQSPNFDPVLSLSPVPFANKRGLGLGSRRQKVYDRPFGTGRGLKSKAGKLMFEKRQDPAGTDPNSPLLGRVNGSIDPWYGCYLLASVWDFALNFSQPWVEHLGRQYNIYDVPDGLDPDVTLDPSAYLNDDRVRSAAHAPLNTWLPFPMFNIYPFGGTYIFAPGSNPYGDPSLEPMVFMDELMANATARGVSVILYSGNDDSLVSHWGTQVVIQNTTWGGTQGFTSAPSTPWTTDSGTFSGIIHQERGMTYVLFHSAGHQVPYYQPEAAMVFVREFVLGNNQTGSVTSSGSVIGGQTSRLSGAVLPPLNAIYTGSGETQGTIITPTQTVMSWRAALQAAAATRAPSQ